MRLKRIRLNGFKSFCDDTVFNFKENGITMIVGPNGCGKSNVVDAIRWVLGEQSPRQLRGAAMSDVIFSGSVSRSPVNRCEVTLIFDNTDGQGLEKYREFSEIAVTRRLYRSGDSDYLINKLPCRLLDVRDLVMDTGAGGRSYSIVEQGKVDEFITASPAERRIFMEEVAGIVRYKTRRIAAERKLEQTHHNLQRVKDVLAELQRQEQSLRGQMEKAREYLDLKEEVGELAHRLLRVRLARSTQRCAALESELAAARQEGEGLQGALAVGQTGLERLLVDLASLESHVRDERSRAYQQERDIQAHETRLALTRQNQDHARRWIQESTRAHEELQARRVRIAEQLQAHRGEAQAAARGVEALRVEIAQLAGRHQEQEAQRVRLQARLQQVQEGLLECHSSLAGLGNQRQMLQERIAEGERRADGMSAQVQTTQDGLQEVGAQASARQAQLEGMRLVADEADAEYARLNTESQGLMAEAAELATSLEGLERTCVALRSRAESLAEIQASYEGFGEAVRNALRWLDATPGLRERYGVVGPLADVVSLPSDVVAWAGAYLAPFLEILLVRETARLPALHAALSAAGHGGVRLWALDTPAAANGHGDGAAMFADVLSVPREHEPVRSGLFGGVRLADGTRMPLPAVIPGTSTLSEWLAADGTYHIDAKSVLTVGGAPAPSLGILRRRAELDALNTELQTQLAARDAAQLARAALAGRQARTAEALRVLEARRNEHAIVVNRHETELEHLLREGSRLRQLLDTQSAEVAQFARNQHDDRARLAELEPQAARWQQQRAALDGELGGLRARLDAAAAEAAELGDQLTERKVALGQIESQAAHLTSRAAALQSDQGETEERLESTADELLRQQQQVSAYAQELETVRAALVSLQAGLAAIQQQVRERQTIYDSQVADRNRQQEQLAADKQRVDAVLARMHELELHLTEERMRREQWQQQLQQQPRPAEPGEPEPQLDEGELQRRLDTSRARLERMAGVNLAAWEEYETLNTRAETMLQQQDDLEAAMHDLRESIRQMNQESRRRFKETFDMVNEQFQKLFPQIFGGGEAKLVLTDAEDLLLAGVDIVAQPPGKKLQSMNLLSGGEKALTAIAMIFAFFLTKPSPYCLLDEVDAPLDDVNVGRFNRLVASMTDRSQFIMITHNKRTMEIGDVLYGVTMEESGVSKVVSVDLGRSS